MSKEITPKESVCPIYLEEPSAEQLVQIENEFNEIAKLKLEQLTAKEAVFKKLGLTADEVSALFS